MGLGARGLSGALSQTHSAGDNTQRVAPLGTVPSTGLGITAVIASKKPARIIEAAQLQGLDPKPKGAPAGSARVVQLHHLLPLGLIFFWGWEGQLL